MQAMSPVVEGLEPYEIILGADQPQYLPLHILRSPGPAYAVMSRWSLSPEERELIAEGSDVYLTLWTFGNAYPPTMMHVMSPSADAESVREQMDLDTELSQRIGALVGLQKITLQNASKPTSEAQSNDPS